MADLRDLLGPIRPTSEQQQSRLLFAQVWGRLSIKDGGDRAQRQTADGDASSHSRSAALQVSRMRPADPSYGPV